MATKTFTGTLIVLNVKKGTGKRGPWKAYSGKVEKPNGEEYEEWVSFGFQKPECKQGDEVVITTKKEDGYWKAQSVEVTKEADGDEDSEDSESGDSGSEDSDDESGQPESSSSKSMAPKKQDNIHYQNSRTAAIELADLLLKHKAVPLTATAGKAGEAARYEEVTALVNKLTVILYHDLSTFRLVRDIEDVYEAPAKAEPGFDGEGEEETSDDSDDE